MRLILNKALDNINDNVNLKIIEITSTDFLNNDLDYFVYKYQIPLIKFTDTKEIFNIKNFKIELSSSLSETELILTESDLELLSGGGGGGGSQDLQSVLDNGGKATMNSGAQYVSFFDTNNHTTLNIRSSTDVNQGYGTELIVEDSGLIVSQTADNISNVSLYLFNGTIGFEQRLANRGTRVGFIAPDFLGTANINFPTKPSGNYTLATLDDIKKIDLTGRVYANNAAAISGGLTTNDVYRTSTGELRIVV